MPIRTLSSCAIFTALMCICAWIGVPFGDTVFTLQTFALFLTLLLLGGKGSIWVCGAYLLLGAAGLPVFSGFRGGVGMLLGPTGGYLWGFLVSAVIYTLCGKRKLPGLILGILACYLCGTLWYWLAFLQGTRGSLWPVLLRCVIPYLIPDSIKLALAWQLHRRLLRTSDS